MDVSCSVVIPTLNNARTIRPLLASIRSQTYHPIETIVADGGSADGTQGIAHENGAIILPCPGKGDTRCLGRNLAARHASGNVLLFVDSDMELEPTVVEECARKVRDGDDAVVIPEVTLGTGLMGAFRRWERSTIQEALCLVFPRAIRSDVFWKLGGFDERMVGFEDMDLEASLLEANSKIARISASILHHEEDVRMGAYLRKRRYYLASADLF